MNIYFISSLKLDSNYFNIAITCLNFNNIYINKN